jgi:fatty acid-binding protein DegV
MKTFFATLAAILVAALIIWLVRDFSSTFDELAKQKTEHKANERLIKEMQEELKRIENQTY